MSQPLPPPDPALAPTSPPRGSRTRWLRLVAPVGVVAVAFGGFAVAQASIDDSGNDSARDLLERTPTTSSSLPDDADDDHATGGSGAVTTGVTFIDDAIADGATQTFSAGAAGTVTISRTGTTLTVVATGAAPGWTSEVERATGPEVEVTFTSGTARVDLEAELEDGGVRVRVRERTTDLVVPGDPTVRTDNSGPGSVSSGHDDTEDDHSGPGSDDPPEIGDDHGGSGSGSDDAPDVDDDHGGSSGSGSSGSGSSGSGSSGSGSGGSGSSGSGSGSTGSGHGED